MKEDQNLEFATNHKSDYHPIIVIVEGCDRTGKDTLIKSLKRIFSSNKTIHACTPKINKQDDLFNFYYNGLIKETLSGYYDDLLNAVFLNRSFYGEYVYGPKYRTESKEEVLNTIEKLEVGQLKTFIRSCDLYFILLTSDNSDLLVNNDDGLSISSDKKDIEDEIKLFDEIFDKSAIENKKRIFVNNGNQFRDKDSIFKEALEFIVDKIIN